MKILVINCGSASLKWKEYASTGVAVQRVAVGEESPGGDYGATVGRVLAALPDTPDVIAHRVVHGGDIDADVARIDAEVLRQIRESTALAPLHNGPALQAIEATRDHGAVLVAAFDSAFHRTMPPEASRYALPELAGVRRYGFHGWSHRYVTERYAEVSGSAAPTIITLHLGGGCSAAAISRGRSVDTSMGFSPLEGLVMSTRSGDVDAGVLLHLLHDGMSLADLVQLLHHQSGLQGLAGEPDMRRLLERTDTAAVDAVDLFCYRIRKYIGAYLAVLQGAEALVFTGGIGEHSAEVRRRVCEPLGWAGIALDDGRNRRGELRVSADGSPVAVYAITTDEELIIARETARLLQAGAGQRAV